MHDHEDYESEGQSGAGAGGPAIRHDGFTPERRKMFLGALRQTGCVRDGCRVAGMSDSTVYKARRRDPEFAALWEAALRMAGADLDLLAYQYAVEGIEEDVIAYGKVVGTRRKRDPGLFRMILQASNPEKYGGQGFGSRAALEKKIRKEIEAEREEAHSEDEIEKVRERIMRKLGKVRERLEEDGHYTDESGHWIPPGYVKMPGYVRPDRPIGREAGNDTRSSGPLEDNSGDDRPVSGAQWPEPDPPEQAEPRRIPRIHVF